MDTLLFLGDFSENSTNISQANAFEKLGLEVVRCDFRRKQIPFFLTGYKYIFYSKCNELGADAMEYTGKKCLWYMDPMNGNYNDSFKAKIPLVDFACFALHDPWINSQHYATPVYLIEEGFDEDVDKPMKSKFFAFPLYSYDVGFIGTLHDAQRKALYKAVKFDIIKCSRLDHSHAVGGTKINLNFCQGGTSDRAYKVMAAGGFLLSHAWPSCPFKDGVDFVSFNGANDLKEKIEYYLANPLKREAIATSGMIAVQKYNRLNWAKRILKLYKECK